MIRIVKTTVVVQPGTRRVPGQALDEGLDQTDEQRAENGPGQIADPPEHGGGERDQPDREAGVVADRLEVEGEEDARRSGQSAREEEDERRSSG